MNSILGRPLSDLALTTEWILALVGAAPPIVTGFVQWGRWIAKQVGGHPVLGLRRGETVDLVVTTSAVVPSAHGVPVSRPMTGHGQIIGMMHAVRSIVRFYGRSTQPTVHFSERIEQPQLDRDLVVLGGPAKNSITKKLLSALMRRYPRAEVEFDDVKGVIGFGGRTVVEGAVDPSVGELPEDFALVVGMRNPFDPSGSSRALLCCGFTSYGTGAAAELLFERLTMARTRFRLMPGTKFRWRWPQNFALIAHVVDPTESAKQMTVVGVLDLDRARADWGER